MFAFVNTYIGNYVAILYAQSFAALTINLAIVMLFKQIVFNVIEYVQEKRKVGGAIDKVDKLFIEPIQMAKDADAIIELEDLKMHCIVEKQLEMKPALPDLVPYYNEAMIQLGFIALFAVAFPFGPLFSFLTNLLEIKIKLNHISEYGRRNVAQAANSIGNWSSIMSFISYFAIPMNVLILIVCRFPASSPGANQDLDAIAFEERSVLIQYMQKQDPNFWNRTNIIILAILMEHFVIALKIVIGLVIPDVPHIVKEDEFRREQILEQVQKEMLEVKLAGGHETFLDMTDRLQRDATKLMQEQL